MNVQGSGYEFSAKKNGIIMHKCIMIPLKYYVVMGMTHIKCEHQIEYIIGYFTGTVNNQCQIGYMEK